MSLTRVKSPGWAAFDLKQRQKQGLVPETDGDSYPPIPSTLTSLHNCKNVTRHMVRPFSSVLLPSMENNDCDSEGKLDRNAIKGNNHDLATKKLNDRHSWADNSLIEDIMEAVNNNFEQASNLLKGMVPDSSSTEENMETKIANVSSRIDGSPCYRRTSENCILEKPIDLSNLSFITGDAHASSVNVSDNAADMKSIMERLSSLPIEPEWEEDDVYLVHRRDAIQMMRSASQHSKAANNAFLRGDHVSAQQQSLNAQKKWLIAERLNSKAAKEILSIRNSGNDIWKLDLHGLHAAEAVQALQEHLKKIEMQTSTNRSVSPSRVKTRDRMIRTPSLESISCTNTEFVDKQRASLRQLQKPLEVITGIGNHSRGQAALPTAVKSFLSENRYHFNQPRPGVISVRPKFRHR